MATTNVHLFLVLDNRIYLAADVAGGFLDRHQNLVRKREAGIPVCETLHPE